MLYKIFLVLSAVLYSTQLVPQKFVGHIQEISQAIAHRMIHCSWKPTCPVSLHDLRYLSIAHWGYDNKVHVGHLVVHKKLAQEMIDIFSELFEAHFPIERMEIIDMYQANDDLSMAANNSSAFCCRDITNRPGIFSRHSYGIAIDINPLVNPYVKNGQVLPSAGKMYLDRTKDYPGIITKTMSNPCYRAFVSRGYTWGGDWKTHVDYQHFEKEIHIVTE